eukprot:TRINITY_DN98104_c0_g1_i1.p1 TRINITY_DN98104_c0_g1~~TRINITY_DN98104_c0_g1_i1.p1  ORF type:complete len:317 (-),score=34.57 TRINITY_DN98104_c0_g1_i1:215-1165(-)
MSPQANSAVVRRARQIRQQNWSGIFDAVHARLFAQVDPAPPESPTRTSSVKGSRHVPGQQKLRVKSPEVVRVETLIRKQAEDLRTAMAAGYSGEPETGGHERIGVALSHAYKSISRKPSAASSRTSKPSEVQEHLKGLVPKERSSESAKPLGFWDDCQLISRQPTPSRQRGTSGTCDRCDGLHASDRCPHFKNPREQHKDAWTHYGASKHPKGLDGTASARVFKRHGRCIPQPGDGNCLFHALCYGLNAGGDSRRTSAWELRLRGPEQQARHCRRHDRGMGSVGLELDCRCIRKSDGMQWLGRRPGDRSMLTAERS